MKNKFLSICGVIAPLLYLAAVVLGGILRPGYSHIGQAISELIEAGAPNKTLLDAMFALYNLLVGIFAVRFLTWKSNGKTRFQKIGAWALIVTAFFGLLMPLFFPMDPRGAEATFQGTMHLVLAGLTSLGTMVSILFIGLWLNAQPGMKGVAVYSLISLAVVFVFGGTAAVSAGQLSPTMGLFERITIGAFIQWVFGMALVTLRIRDVE